MSPDDVRDDRSTRGDDERRAQLLDAAGRVFHRGPVGGLTLAAVAEEAGVSRRLMYHYFADLQSLYNELFDARILDHEQSIDAELAELGPATTEALLDTAVRRFLALPASYRRWTLMACTDTLPAELAAQRDQIHESLMNRWGGLDVFEALTPATTRTVMLMIVTNVCLLGTAIADGHLTLDQATNLAVASIVDIARAAREATAD